MMTRQAGRLRNVPGAQDWFKRSGGAGLPARTGNNAPGYLCQRLLKLSRALCSSSTSCALQQRRHEARGGPQVSVPYIIRPRPVAAGRAPPALRHQRSATSAPATSTARPAATHTRSPLAARGGSAAVHTQRKQPRSARRPATAPSSSSSRELNVELPQDHQVLVVQLLKLSPHAVAAARNQVGAGDLVGLEKLVDGLELVEPPRPHHQ